MPAILDRSSGLNRLFDTFRHPDPEVFEFQGQIVTIFVTYRPIALF
jgi:hypothetical protein